MLTPTLIRIYSESPGRPQNHSPSRVEGTPGWRTGDAELMLDWRGPGFRSQRYLRDYTTDRPQPRQVIEHVWDKGFSFVVD